MNPLKAHKKCFFRGSPLPLARLVLEDGTVFKGTSIGAFKSVAGETVFCTGMVGYEQALTDPSFFGQLLCFTYPLIGNYGVPSRKKTSGLHAFFESKKIQASGVIVSEYSCFHNHWNSPTNFFTWLEQENVPGIAGIDTRALTQHLRTKGTLLGKIIVEKDVPKSFDPNQTNVLENVSTKKIEEFGDFSMRVVLIDCGTKNNIIRSLLKRKISVLKVPWNYDFLANGLAFDGIVVSNGPGNPVFCSQTIQILQKAMRQCKPIFGICLGNQLLALAAGAKTYKLKFGHRSQNQPCQLVGEKRAFVTAQNHGFAVNTKTLPRHWKPWFENANDNTNEGIYHSKKPFCSVQFHPEAMPGPKDTTFLFDEFKKELKR